MFHGSMVAIVTPMTSEGLIDYSSLTKLVNWHLEQGTDAIVVAGTTGEAATLTHEEKQHLISHVVKQVAERIPVIAGTGECSVNQTVKLTNDAQQLGADACLIMTPPYIKPTQQGLVRYYQNIAQQVALPIIVYNVPGRTACDLLPETLAELADISNIVGIKEATGSLNRLVQILDLCQDKIDVYSGDDFTAKDLMRFGAKGVISVTANVAPKLMAQLARAATTQDHDLANQIDAALQPLHQALFVETSPIPTKWALAKMNLIRDRIRLPLTTMNEIYQQQVITALQHAGIKNV